MHYLLAGLAIPGRQGPTSTAAEAKAEAAAVMSVLPSSAEDAPGCPAGCLLSRQIAAAAAAAAAAGHGQLLGKPGQQMAALLPLLVQGPTLQNACRQMPVSVPYRQHSWRRHRAVVSTAGQPAKAGEAGDGASRCGCSIGDSRQCCCFILLGLQMPGAPDAHFQEDQWDRYQRHMQPSAQRALLV